MTQLLIQGATILAQGPFVDDGENIIARREVPYEWRDDDGNLVATITVDDSIFPKHVINGWQIVDATLPDGFTPAGYTWDGTQVVAKPADIPPAPRIMTSLAFFALFSQAEEDAISTAATQNGKVLFWLTKAAAAELIDLDSPVLRAGMAGLLAAGLITQDRHDRILSGLPPI